MTVSIQEFFHQASKQVRTGFAGLSLSTTKSRILVVTGNESADLDSFTSALVFAYITSTIRHAPWLSSSPWAYDAVIPVFNVTDRQDLKLRPELSYLLSTVHVPVDRVITTTEFVTAVAQARASRTGTHHVTVDAVVVDHNNLTASAPALAALIENNQHDSNDGNVVAVIDHHDDEGKYLTATPRLIRPAGSCTSLVVNYFAEFFRIADHDDAAVKNDVARLALGPVLVDTANLTSRTTDDDTFAAQLLTTAITAGTTNATTIVTTTTKTGLENDEFFQNLASAKRDVASFTLDDILRKDYKQFTSSSSSPSFTVGISSSVKSLDWILAKFSGPEFVRAVLAFAHARGLDAVLFMDSFHDDDDDEFKRELVVITVSAKVSNRIDRFVATAKHDLQLLPYEPKRHDNHDSDEPQPVAISYWKQQNIKASRKQVAPLLRKFL
ncbi:hypothetical protein V1514DRAFT_333534, partial [Lipomyces japonicus]|uniref:uncharacterized protein n=1 Tax=Lipomyces japonicus TaxID=56871 RepID=UPI0034CD2EF8